MIFNELDESSKTFTTPISDATKKSGGEGRQTLPMQFGVMQLGLIMVA